jgi:trk system potassium uptake protein TrkA
MRILITGAGRFGAHIARVLAAAQNEITVIEQDDDRVEAIEATVPARIVVGDACEPSILEEASAHNADLVIATTGDDEDNLVISLLAKRQFAVPRVIARVNDAENGWLFDSRWGVDVAVPATSQLTSLIEEAVGITDTVALLRLARGGVNVIETAIDESMRAAGRPLSEITLPAGSVVAAVIRNGEPHVPEPEFVLMAGDELIVISENATGPDIHAAFH